ncbi:MAG: M28 family peptidase [Verrucomicrobiales bacterium]
MKQETVIKAAVVGLPIGLVLLGVLSMVYYFRTGAHDSEWRASEFMHREIEEKDLREHVRVLSEVIGERHSGKPQALERAAKYLESSLGVSNMGYRVLRRNYSAGGETWANLEVEIPGRGRRDEIVVVGAHYDSVRGGAGANDNGTGIAALLAIANSLVGSHPARTLRFVAFANEEAPHFQSDSMGSLHYAREARLRDERIVAMLCFDTLGYYTDEPDSQKYPEAIAGKYPSTGNFVAFVSDIDSGLLLAEVVSAFEGATDFPCIHGAFPAEVPGVSWSDHWSFWQAGYPAVLATDTAPFRYPWYHAPGDLPDKIDFARFTEVVRGLEGVVRELASPR